LSGLIFPVSSMASGVQWIAYVLPLKYFIDISRGVMLKAAPLSALWGPLLVLAGMAVVVLGLAVLRFRRDLAPSARRGRTAEADSKAVAA
jgi:ABC-2 type transport system permease protein